MPTPTYRTVNITATLLGIDRRLSIVILLRAFLVFRHVSFVAALAAFGLLWSMAYWITKHDVQLIVIAPKASAVPKESLRSRPIQPLTHRKENCHSSCSGRLVTHLDARALVFPRSPSLVSSTTPCSKRSSATWACFCPWPALIRTAARTKCSTHSRGVSNQRFGSSTIGSACTRTSQTFWRRAAVSGELSVARGRRSRASARGCAAGAGALALRNPLVYGGAVRRLAAPQETLCIHESGRNRRPVPSASGRRIAIQHRPIFPGDCGDALPTEVLAEREARLFLRGLVNYDPAHAAAFRCTPSEPLDYTTLDSQVDIHPVHLQVNEYVVKTVGLKNLPASTQPNLLQELLTIPCDLIVCSEWKPQSNLRMRRLIHCKQRSFDALLVNVVALAIHRHGVPKSELPKKHEVEAHYDSLGECMKEIENGATTSVRSRAPWFSSAGRSIGCATASLRS